MKENFTRFKERLKEEGIRLTRQREAILMVLLDADRPITALDIFSVLENDFPNLQLSTVYRNLNYFEKKDLLRKMDLDRDKKESYFELMLGEHHHHLICVDCDEIVALDCPLRDYETQLKAETNYTILDHKVKIFGICPKCQKSNK